MKKLTIAEIKEIKGLRKLFPPKISVKIHRSESGEFLACVDTLEGFVTEGNNFSELIEMVNDAVKTYFEVPEKFIPYMPNYIPPIAVAQRLDIFPAKETSEKVVFPLAISEAATR